jgi:hypothetical protein
MGAGLLAIPLLLMLFGGLSSPVPILVCLPAGLGLIMWESVKETTARLGIFYFGCRTSDNLCWNGNKHNPARCNWWYSNCHRRILLGGLERVNLGEK